jgi:S-formylglutathione hydrolase FrmB
LKILEEVEKQFKVDPQHRSLIGRSMGGYGAWAIGAAARRRCCFEGVG